MTSQIIIIAVYLLMLVGIAIFTVRKTKTTSDFMLGGRKIGPWMSAFAYGTTYFSAVMFVGYAGKFGWAMGISATWIGIANAVIGTFLAWKLLARPTRQITRKLDSATMPDFFLKRYLSSKLKIASAIIIFVFLLPYCASVYQGLGYFFESVFGNFIRGLVGVDTIMGIESSYFVCMCIMAAFTLFYLLMGGYIATAMTDFVQGLIMVGGVILMVIFVLSAPQVGGLFAGLEKVGAQAGISFVTPFGSPNTLVLLISLIILTSLGTWGLPQMVHKFYAIKDESAIKRGTVISTLFALLVGGAAYFIGTFGKLFLTEVPAAGMDAIMPEMMKASLPPVMLGLILVLILAASMSTLSSLVLVSSSSISLDLIKGIIKPKIKDKTSMVWMRSLCAVFVVISLIIALLKPAAIVTLMSYSWGALSGCFLAPFLLGVKWKGMTKAGAWAGIVTGLVITVPLMVLGFIGGILPAWLSAPTIGSISMLVSLIVTPLVSLMTKKFTKEHIENVFAA